MKFNFRKIASAFASAVMLSSTVGFAAAASWPAPFVTDGVANAAVVYPSATGYGTASDAIAALSIQKALELSVDDTEEATTYTGDGWLVEGKNNFLELGESLYQVQGSIDEDELDILAEQEFADGEFKQKITFANTTSSSVYYTTDDLNFDEDTPGLYFVVDSEAPIFTYTATFNPKPSSEVDETELVDFVNSEISMLGKTYTITRAVNVSGGLQLDLMGGAEKVTLSNGENVVIDGHTVSVQVRETNDVVFTVDGKSGRTMDVNDVKEINGVFVAVTDIAYQNYAGGLSEATFFLGGDKIELKNNQKITVNDEGIEGTLVTIGSTVVNDEIELGPLNIYINNSKTEKLYIAEGDLLSEHLKESEALFGENWDLVFEGLDKEDIEYETVLLKPSSDNEEYTLDFATNDYSLSVPLAYASANAINPGAKSGQELVFDASANITKDQYFFVSSSNTSSSSADAEVCFVKYTGASYDPKTISFDVMDSEDDPEEVAFSDFTAITVSLCGEDYTFHNTTSGSNFKIALDSANNVMTGTTQTKSLTLRTKYNTKILVTDTNTTIATDAITVNVTIDDDDEADNYVTFPHTIFSASITGDAEGEVSSVINDDAGWADNPENEDERTYITSYGAEISEITASSSEAKITVEIPETLVGAKVKVTEGAVTMGGSTGEAVSYVTDKETASFSGKNLIVVGGSCINTAAAKLLGSEEPICTTAFTTATKVGEGGYIIKVFDNPWDTGSKIAMLVAGYEMDETTRAAKEVAEFAEGKEIANDLVIINPTVA